MNVCFQVYLVEVELYPDLHFGEVQRRDGVDGEVHLDVHPLKQDKKILVNILSWENEWTLVLIENSETL